MFSLHSVWYDGKDRSEYSVAILNLNEEKRESQNMLQSLGLNIRIHFYALNELTTFERISLN